jgi:hypothetical protein
MGGAPVSAARSEAVERATKVWAGQLVDLTARNNLLYFRDLKVGTLSLDGVAPASLADVLAGRTVSLSRLFPDADTRADALKRARAVRSRAQEHFEERGLETLFIGCGVATWTNQRTAATPAAPVLLVPARLAARGAAQEEFELSVTGEAELNPTFLHMLRSEFECALDDERLLGSAGIEGLVESAVSLDSLYASLRGMRRCAGVRRLAALCARDVLLREAADGQGP